MNMVASGSNDNAVNPICDMFSDEQCQNLFLYAKKNKKFKYFVPTKSIGVGGLTTVDWVMVDSGCASYLFHLKAGQLGQLLQNNQLYTFSIGTSSGVGVFSSCTLEIEPKFKVVGAGFPIQFPPSSQVIQLPWLRCQLCFEDAQELLNAYETNVETFSLKKPEKLRQYIADTQKLRDAEFGGAGERSARTHSLFGQRMLDECHWLQTQDYLFVTANRLSEPEVVEYLRIARNQSSLAIGIGVDEFDDLRDDDHEGEDDLLTMEEYLMDGI